MRYIDGVKDRGVVISPSVIGEEFYKWDGGGIREAIVKKVDGVYRLSYDGAMPGKRHDSYWNVCEAVSVDLTHWEKRGPMLVASALAHPDSNGETYPDFCSASSPWDYFDGKRWYRYYVGADHCSPEGVPAFTYWTMLATADSAEGPWHKECEKPGKSNYVCLAAGEPGSWNDATVSPGAVIYCPEKELPYLMFYSGSCFGYTRRSLGIARTKELSACDSAKKTVGNFWIKDKDPILPPAEDIENSSIYYEEENGLYWLFTNHIKDNMYTDAVWVYYSRDLESWNVNDKAIVIDNIVSSFARGAIGMPSVIRISDNKLALFYDATVDGSISHLDRHIALAEIDLPIRLK